MTVAAVIRGDGRVRSAVEAQDARPDAVLAGGAAWPRTIAAAAAQHEWVWLVEGDTEPAPDALRRLLAVAHDPRGLPVPDLLSSRVLSADGTLDPVAAPWPPLHDRHGAMLAAVQHLAAVRLARWGSLLVRADAIHRHGPPRAGWAGVDDLEWTGRLLRGGHGYLVPDSRATLLRPRPGGVRSAVASARLMASGPWVSQERLWFLYATLLEGSRRRPSRRARPTVRRLSPLRRLVRR